ncbi:MAG: hypothetical protein LBE76_08195 [Nitrososphaerota archaeon]|jgi:hypothetical protein|nr:hypothetical protein [Nitrososphaerota archaeon]
MTVSSKKLALLLIFSLFSSGLFLVGFCVAPVTMPANHSVAPEVSAEIQHKPLVIPPTYTTNPYTGETQQTSSESIDPRGNITVTIKNRSFNTYTDKNGNIINIYYVFFIKSETQSGEQASSPQYVEYQSNSGYTTITFPYSTYGLSKPYHIQLYKGMVWNFRVQAVTGYFTPGYEKVPSFGSFDIVYVDPVYEGEGSAFTEFTINIPTSDKPSTSKPNISSPPKTPTTSNPYIPPQQNIVSPKLMIILVSICIIVILIAVIALYIGRQRKREPLNFVRNVGCEVKAE